MATNRSLVMPDKAGRRDPLSSLNITDKEASRHSVPLM